MRYIHKIVCKFVTGNSATPTTLLAACATGTLDMTAALDNIINTPVAPNYGAPAAGFRNWIQEPITCADGTQVSVQASRGHYCHPRGDNAPYSALEVQIDRDEAEGLAAEWEPYKDGFTDSPSGVYGYVPVEMVRALILAHGGEAQA